MEKIRELLFGGEGALTQFVETGETQPPLGQNPSSSLRLFSVVLEFRNEPSSLGCCKGDGPFSCLVVVLISG